MRTLNEQDVAFLKELQHELQTQDNFGTADPHYWHIEETKTVRTFEGNGEVGIIDFEGDVFFGDDITEKLLECIRYQGLEPELFHCYGDMDDWSYNDQFENATLIWSRHLKERFPYELGYFTEEYRTAYPLFLTYKECKEHIKRYGYNYSKPHALCIYSDRTPNFEKLLDILTNVDFEQLKTGE